MKVDDVLPLGWANGKVGEIAQSIQYGFTASAVENRAGPRFLRITDIQGGQVDWKSVPSCEIPESDIAKYQLEPGDILFARTGATTGKSYVVKSSPLSVYASYLIRLRPFDGIEPAFIQYFFQTNDYWRQIEAAKRGIGQPNVNASLLGGIRLPVAPWNEQKRIVFTLDELLSDLDAGAYALKRAQANLKKYRAAVLKAAVTGELTAEWRAAHPNVEPANELLDRILAERRRKTEAKQESKFAAAGKALQKGWQARYVEPTSAETRDMPPLPVRWCWAELDQLATLVKNGYFQSPSKVSEGHRILRINAVRPMAVNLDEVRYLPTLVGDASDCYVRDGDLLLTRYNGSIELLGVAGLVRNCSLPTIHPDKLIRVNTAIPTPLPEYLEIACNVGVSRRHIVRRARTTAGQTGISGGDVKSMPIPLPPLAEQEVILAEVERHVSVIAATDALIEASLKRGERLRQSILKEAFAGRLVPQNPSDEPASALLDRIREARSVTNGHTSPQQHRAPRRPRRKTKPAELFD